MSFTDLAYLKCSDIKEGRIFYKRRKTHKNYSIRLFWEAESLIDQIHVSGDAYILHTTIN